MKKLLSVAFLLYCSITLAQNTGQVSGTVRNEMGEPLENVIVRVYNSQIPLVVTNVAGRYTILIPQSEIPVKVSYSLTGYLAFTLTINPADQQAIVHNVTLQSYVQALDEVIILSGVNGIGNLQNIDLNLLQNLPTTSQNFESILKTLPGVSTNNELSAQYTVRGGNFDENLVYINDVEIFRPLLTRSGQQEGLSALNADLASYASFSAGGFRSRYGDKISSVLDVRYGRPDSSSIVVAVGLTGISGAWKALSTDRKSYILIGLRSKLNRNILNNQEVKGSYNSNFHDLQFLAQTELSSKLSLSLLGSYNKSQFELIPEDRETKFSTLTDALQFNINYEGFEQDKYETRMGAVTWLYKSSDKLNFKWISSVFEINEHENFDIQGRYVLNGLAARGGNPGYTIGANRNYGDNRLNVGIYSSEMRMYFQTKKTYIEVGSRFQREQIADQLDEYSRLDSRTSGGLDTSIIVNFVRSDNRIATNRFMGFLESTLSLSQRIKLSAGIRANYSSYTEEILWSPRIGMLFDPLKKQNISYRFSAGIYNQPPFYRELRNMNGSLEPNSRAQRSLQLLSAVDYGFKNSTLKFSTELYYKQLDKLIPYKIEDLKIRYLADQKSSGYAAGIDFSLHGEFVNNMESSFRLSLLKSSENVVEDAYTNANNTVITPGYLRRPTDQRVNFSIFFQDRVLNNPANKVHVNVLYGSALLVGPPQTERYLDVFKIPSYKRIDIGFSKDFVDPSGKRQSTFLKRYFNSLNVYAEIFNVLNIKNTVSYLWIRDTSNNHYAIPNYLTSRQLNIRIIANIKYK